jgi:hypothetical protein
MNNEQQARVAEFISQLPWGDFDGAICDVQLSLRLLLEATREALLMWEAEAEERGYEDEFSLTTDDVRNLTDEWRLAYVGRLIKSLALVYGLRENAREAEAHTPAGVLHRLNDISWMPMTNVQDLD